MPLSSRDEILTKYAMAQGFDKCASNALMVSNVSKALALEGAAAGLGAGIGAATGGGALAGAVGALGSNPLGWIVGGAILLGGLGWAIYDALNTTDDNIDDLIARFEALDIDGTPAENAVTGWISILQNAKQSLQIPTASGSNEERVTKGMEAVLALQDLLYKMDDMNKSWPAVKGAVKDWKWTGSWGDIGEAEVALRQTTEAMKQMFAKLQAQAQQDAQMVIKELQKGGQQDYSVIAKEVLDLYKQLTAAAGKEPSFDTSEERVGYNLAGRIASDPTKINFLTIKDDLVHMTSLRDLMRQGLKQLQERKIKTKSSTEDRPLSKRSLTLGDGTKIMAPGTKGVAQKSQKTNKANPTIVAIQRAINHLAATYVPEMNPVSVDGRYGPETGGALSAIMVQAKDIRESLQESAGVSVRTVQNYQYVRQNPDILSSIQSSLSKFVGRKRQDLAPAPGGTEQQGVRQQDAGSGMPCAFDKENLTTNEIDACLRHMVMNDARGNKTTAYDLMKFCYGLNTPAERASVIRDALSTRGVLPDANTWTDWGRDLMHYLVQTFGPGCRGQYNFM